MNRNYCKPYAARMRKWGTMVQSFRSVFAINTRKAVIAEVVGQKIANSVNNSSAIISDTDPSITLVSSPHGLPQCVSDLSESRKTKRARQSD